ncbi:MAG TPA: LuxR C-terminal-related transcriptional regulator [Usitatibacter sp.]|nr:LuxR C-terminal-related transcriptional regulator [Usitatibacter sp.]
MSPRLFQAKLRPPLDTGGTLARPEVLRVQALAGARLVLASGPAGFGKTTAMCQYERELRAGSIATCWITLDADDNDPARFTAYLREALARVVPAVAQVAPRGSASPGDRGAVLAEAFDVIDALASSEEPLAIFLDDFEKITDREILGLVTRLLRTLARGQQVVIGTREIPDLGIARMRASGQLAEIGPEQLRFSREEARRFLVEARSCAISEEDVAFLHARSEGWPAALQLAALAFAEHPERARDLRNLGSLAEISDYLAAEVLGGLPPDLRAFLAQTSVLDTFSAELCEAVTGVYGAAGMLERIARANLLLMPLDSEHRWFRYHALCAEFLRGEFEREHGAEVPELNRRAARWLAQQGRFAPAVEHALRSGDGSLAAAIVAQCATAYLHEGQVMTLVRWAEAVPAECIAAHPGLDFIVALATVVMHRYDAAKRLIDAMDHQGAGQPEARRRDVLMLRFNLAIWSDRLEGLRDALNQAVAVISPADGFAYASMLNCVAFLGMLENNEQMARSALAAAKASPHHRDNEVVRAYSEGEAAMAHLVRGEMREAEDIARAEFDRLVDSGRRYGTPGAIAAIVLADALYERNEVAAARVLLDEFLNIAEDTCIPDFIVCAFLERSRIARIEGESELADDLAGRLRRIGERRGLPRLVASALLEKSRVALLEGRIETAAAHVAGAADPALWSVPVFRGAYGNDLENPDTGRARLELFRGGTAAIAPLESQIRAAEAAGRTRRAFKLRVLLAQAQWISGQRRPAVRQLLLVLAQAAPEGLVRVFADEAWVLRDMLANSAAQLEGAGGAFARRVAQACGPSPESASVAPGAREILSPREIEILALLAHGMSNKEIARGLSRSEATVATHLRRIYEKLGAHTRTQAIAIARRGGLIA